jgi:hypothetical protein
VIELSGNVREARNECTWQNCAIQMANPQCTTHNCYSKEY